MSTTERHPLSLKPVLYTIPGIDDVRVQTDITLAGAGGAPLQTDVYYPRAGGAPAPPPVVVIVPGYVDEGMRRGLGCRHKEMASTVWWARLIAASGMAALAYGNHAPAADLAALLRHLSSSASTSLGLDGGRIGLWSCSGNVPVALSALLTAAPVRPACAALVYGYTMDLGDATEVAGAAKTFGFDHACAGRSIDDLAADVPMFLARAGRDETAGLNAALDRFAAAALARNLPISLINHAEGPHAFDLLDDSGTTREVIRCILGFLAFHLGATRPLRA